MRILLPAILCLVTLNSHNFSTSPTSKKSYSGNLPFSALKDLQQHRSAGMGNLFGETISSAGDLNNDGYSDVIIADPNFDSLHQDEGRVWVYYGTGEGLPDRPDVTLSYYSNPDGYETFGFAAAGAGDINHDGYSDLVIGAHRAGGGAEEYNGRVLVYYGSATGIHTSPDKILSDEAGASSFGLSVAGGGDINGDGFSDVIIGAPSYGYIFNQQNYYGRAYVYYGSSAGLASTPGSVINGELVRGSFGYVVTNAGDINGDGFSDIAVSADGLTDYDGNNGIVTVYLGSDTGLQVSYVNKFTISQTMGFSGFGRSMAGGNDLNGDGYADLVISQPFYPSLAETPGGSTLVHIPRIWTWYGSAAGFNTDPVIISQSPAGLNRNVRICNAGDCNGDGYADVAISGSHTDSTTLQTTGRLVVYYGSKAGLTATEFRVKDSMDLPAGFGIAAAGDVNGDGYADLLGGKTDYTSPSVQPEGIPYICWGKPDGTGVTASVATLISPGNSVVGFGRSLCDAGDINGDGFADIIVGDPSFITGNLSYDGAAYVYYGAGNGLPGAPGLVLRTKDPSSKFGWAVAGAGDINGDGYQDVLVSEPQFKHDEGKVFIYYGSPVGLFSKPAVLTGGEPGVYLGYAIAGAGDINGDGYADILVSAYNGINNIDTGKVFVYYGARGGIDSKPSLVLQGVGESGNAGFGRSLGSAGDVNGDGFADVIIGAASGIAGQGRAYIFHGAAAGLIQSPAKVYGSPNTGQSFTNCHVAAAGDVNGDGFSDVLVWTLDASTGLGKELIYLGSPSGTGSAPAGYITGNAQGVWVEDARSAGDVNSDGYADVLAFVNWEHGHGIVLVYQGSENGLLAAADTLRNPRDEAAGGFGKGFSSAGDVNGDGYADIVVGEESSIDIKGRAYLFYGTGNKAYRNNIRLYNADMNHPLSTDNIKKEKFAAGLFAKSPLGLQKGRLVWETRSEGTAFSGMPLPVSTAYTGRQGVFLQLGLTGKELKAPVHKTENVTYIRARVEYDLTTAVTGQRFGPWRYAQGGVLSTDRYSAGFPGILKFTAVQHQHDVLLNWTVPLFRSGVFYSVERSGDNANFRELQKIPAHWYSNEYFFRDEHPLKGNNYYRIRIHDQYKEKYSQVICVVFREPHSCVIQPNPVRAGQLLNVWLSPAPGNAMVEWLDSKRKLVARSQINTNNERFNIRAPYVTTGIYWVIIRTTHEIIARQVLIL